MNTKNILTLVLLAGISLPAAAQWDIIDSVAYKNQTVNVGTFKKFSREQSSASVSIITNKDVSHRGARNIGNDIIGQGTGLTSLQGSGRYDTSNPTFYIRGLQSLTNSTALILVDGIERSIEDVDAQEVESVTILKDAAATALYGYKGANGAILITTKRGEYDSKSVRFSYDHDFSYFVNKPKFLDAATYASAVNEARSFEGLAPLYSDAAIQAYKNGTDALNYPNVNWVDETFRDVAHTNKFNVEFKGGTRNFRYYTMAALVTDKGFIKNTNLNDEYSTQNKYTRFTLRSNMDMDIRPKTKLHTNILAVLTESSQPGAQADLWSMIYTVPANAFPIKAADGIWGGDGTYTTKNPVAQSCAAAYYKTQNRALYANMSLEQDLSSITEGLGFNIGMGYDTHSMLYEDYSKTYRYGYYKNGTLSVDGSDSELGTGHGSSSWVRRCSLDADVHYDQTFGKHSVYGQLKWDYEFNDMTGTNTTVYRNNYSLFAHYGYADKYMADVTLMYSGSSRLAKGTKWAFSPTVAASWNLHKEDFLKDVEGIDFLKVRASAGLQQLDLLPGDNIWAYNTNSYTISGGTYNYYSTMGGEFTQTNLSQTASLNPSREKSMKYNFGVDATFGGCVNISLDYYYQHRYDIWCSTSGSYTSVFGFTTPYENIGVVNSQGFEMSVDYQKQFTNGLSFTLGTSLTINKNKVKEQGETPQVYDNLVSTGLPVNQLFGYRAVGFFKSSDDINGDGVVSSDECKTLGYPVHNLGTVRPGDVRYSDVNGDDVIDTNDRQTIGYNIYCPEVYYTFHIGMEYKKIGFDAQFQGAMNYTGVMNTNGMFRTAVGSNTVSQYYYDNRWTVENQGEYCLFPRLSTSSNPNNDVTSTLNVFSRSFCKLRSLEVYYYLPENLVKKSGFISNVKIYGRGVDLFSMDLFGKFDPEGYGATQPLTRSLQLGAALTF